MTAPVFKLVKDTKNPHECKKIDVMRVKKTSAATFTKIATCHWMNFYVRQELLLSTCLTVMSGAIRSGAAHRLTPLPSTTPYCTTRDSQTSAQ